MKPLYKVKFLALLLVMGMSLHAQKFHDFSIEDKDNNTVALKSLKGKKIMLIIMGGTNMDTSFLNHLVSFGTRYKDSIKVIAMHSNEDGNQLKNFALYLKENKDALSSVIFTKGYFTRNGAKQSNLVKWLTEKEQNKHYAQAVKGVGQKFFIDESGELYGVLGPEVPLNSKMVERAVHRN